MTNLRGRVERMEVAMGANAPGPAGVTDDELRELIAARLAGCAPNPALLARWEVDPTRQRCARLSDDELEARVAETLRAVRERKGESA